MKVHRPGPLEQAPHFRPAQRLLLAVVPPLAVTLLRLLGHTLRFTTLRAPAAQPADETTTPALYVFWHRCLLLSAWRYRHLGIHILISSSFDGELIARTVARLGFIPVRGSSSRGGTIGLLTLSRALAAGHKCAITADGPRGPLYVSKPGAAAIAQHAAARTGTPQPLSAFYLHPVRAWTLRSWDRFLIPRPFTRVTAAWTTQLLSTDPNLPEHLQATLEQAVGLAEAVALAEAE